MIMWDPDATQDERLRLMLRELRLLLSRVAYRPGWKLAVDRVEPTSVRVEVTGPVLDSDQPDRETRLVVPRYIGFHELEEVTSSYSSFVRWVHDFLLEVERHECGEWFRFDGRKPFDPHAGDIKRQVDTLYQKEALSSVFGMMRADASSAFLSLKK